MNESGNKKIESSKLLTLFVVMLKIGFTCFGSGWSIVAQIDQEFVQKREWTTSQDLTNCAMMARALPGITIMNTVVFFANSVAGPLGAVIACFGCAIPSIVVLLFVSAVYNSICTNPYVVKAMIGVRASVVAITASVAIRMLKTSLKNWVNVIIMIVALGICFTPLPKAVLIFSAIGVGVADYYIRIRRKNGNTD